VGVPLHKSVGVAVAPRACFDFGCPLQSVEERGRRHVRPVFSAALRAATPPPHPSPALGGRGLSVVGAAMSDAVNPDAAPPPAPRTGPWGLWATMGLSMLVVLVYCIAVALVLGGFAAAAAAAIRDGAFHFGEFAGAIATNGLVQSLSVLAAAVACCVAMVLFVRWRRAGTVRDYLALRAVSWRTALAWFSVYVVLFAAVHGLLYALELPASSDLVRRQFETAGSVPLFVLAIVVVGPILEEVFFRGFMFAGIAASRLGLVGAVAITSLLWAVVHVQYDIAGVTAVLSLGIVLGVARAMSGSILLTFALHAAGNLAAIIELMAFPPGP